MSCGLCVILPRRPILKRLRPEVTYLPIALYVYLIVLVPRLPPSVLSSLKFTLYVVLYVLLLVPKIVPDVTKLVKISIVINLRRTSAYPLQSTVHTEINLLWKPAQVRCSPSAFPLSLHLRNRQLTNTRFVKLQPLVVARRIASVKLALLTGDVHSLTMCAPLLLTEPRIATGRLLTDRTAPYYARTPRALLTWLLCTPLTLPFSTHTTSDRPLHPKSSDRSLLSVSGTPCIAFVARLTLIVASPQSCSSIPGLLQTDIVVPSIVAPLS